MVRVVDVVTEGSGTDTVFLFGVSVVKPKDEHTWDCLCGRAIDTAYNTCRVCGGWRCVCTIGTLSDSLVVFVSTWFDCLTLPDSHSQTTNAPP